MAEFVHGAKSVPLNQGTDEANEEGRQDQTWPIAHVTADLIAKVGAQHVEARVSKVQHAHHAENERQSAGQQEQQHAVKQAVQTGKDNKFEHRAVASVSGIDGYGEGAGS